MTRVLTLLELLQAGGVRPVRELADRLEVDERTVRRYVGHLLDLGVPVEAVRGRYGGYRIGSATRLPPLMLTEEEALAVALSLFEDRRRGTATETALAKILRVLPHPLTQRLDALLGVARSTATPAERAGTPATATLLTIAEAVRDERPVEIRYSDRSGSPSERTVLPWGLVAHAGRWYLTGPDSASSEVRSFRLDRIAHVVPGRGRFTAPAGFDPARDLLGRLARTPWTHEVAVVVQAPVERIRARFPAGIALIASDAERGDGWHRVRLRAEHLDWVAAELAALDAPFVVESPDALRDSVAALAGKLLSLVDR